MRNIYHDLKVVHVTTQHDNIFVIGFKVKLLLGHLYKARII